MKTTKLVVSVGFLLSGLATCAQEPSKPPQSYPKFELAVDYSYAHYNPSHAFVQHGNSLNGAGGSIDFNFNKFIGVKAELTGYGSKTQAFVIPAGATPNCPAGCAGNASGNLFTYLFGPQLGLRTGRYRPFGALLFGSAHSNIYTNLNELPGFVGTVSADGNTFAMLVGGGLDIPVTHSGAIAIRPAEVSYLYTRFNNAETSGQSNFRYQAGAVVNF